MHLNSILISMRSGKVAPQGAAQISGQSTQRLCLISTHQINFPINAKLSEAEYV